MGKILFSVISGYITEEQTTDGSDRSPPDRMQGEREARMHHEPFDKRGMATITHQAVELVVSGVTGNFHGDFQ